jgi:hypothetical protein
MVDPIGHQRHFGVGVGQSPAVRNSGCMVGRQVGGRLSDRGTGLLAD